MNFHKAFLFVLSEKTVEKNLDKLIDDYYIECNQKKSQRGINHALSTQPYRNFSAVSGW